MAFCTNCGAAVAEGVRFCPQCGREVGAQTPGGPAPPPQATGAPPAAGGVTRNVAGMLCYILGVITGVLFLVLEPYSRDPFIRFHAFQSIFFNVVVVVIAVVLGIVPLLGWILYPFFLLAAFIVWIVLMVQAYQERRWKLPVIGDLAEQQVGKAQGS